MSTQVQQPQSQQNDQENIKKQISDDQDNSLQQYDYSKCLFECRLYEEKLLNTKLIYCYISNEEVAICKDIYQDQPDQIIPLNTEVKVQWIYDKTKKPYERKGFQFKKIKNPTPQYFAEPDVLEELKKVFMKKIFQARFLDEYDVLSRIGQGNYARVFAIQNFVTGEKYAVKCFDKKHYQTVENGVASIYNEIKIMRALDNHNNIVKIHETFEGDNTYYYFVMEYVEGGKTLYDEIKNRGFTQNKQFTEEEVQFIMRMIISAISHLADNKIMHRDLKPENILYSKRGDRYDLKILDFGLAAYEDEYPYMFPKCGTPGYVAPEVVNLQDKQKGYSCICDMFSVGSIFNVLLIGEGLFPGREYQEVLQKNGRCELNLESKSYEFVSKEAKDLLTKMLQKDPQNRISAKDALKHEYFKKNYSGNGNTSNSYASNRIIKTSSVQNLDQQNQQIQLVNRNKKKSVFNRPVPIPYLSQEPTIDPNYNVGSFQVQNQNMWIKQNSKNSNQLNLPQCPYYTVGSMDQNQLQSNQQKQQTQINQNQQNNQIIMQNQQYQYLLLQQQQQQQQQQYNQQLQLQYQQYLMMNNPNNPDEVLYKLNLTQNPNFNQTQFPQINAQQCSHLQNNSNFSNQQQQQFHALNQQNNNNTITQGINLTPQHLDISQQNNISINNGNINNINNDDNNKYKVIKDQEHNQLLQQKQGQNICDNNNNNKKNDNVSNSAAANNNNNNLSQPIFQPRKTSYQEQIVQKGNQIKEVNEEENEN
ncbi:Protein kinase-like domain [Pseudocohnilembus persalinus]|uniref:Protein kinase-like domain n=1 Tax=Pseudocohnilembus persalinus TaxID=266149 RepID=A0A0V0Q924_PSEPJ|nr:Protein kinase-like domain [Pseudocohnilembus persalinus]|eukprot:KRW98666.1 Protein kinase-like domain [Pseudocohnilembus persalinus]